VPFQADDRSLVRPPSGSGAASESPRFHGVGCDRPRFPECSWRSPASPPPPPPPSRTLSTSRAESRADRTLCYPPPPRSNGECLTRARAPGESRGVRRDAPSLNLYIKAATPRDGHGRSFARFAPVNQSSRVSRTLRSRGRACGRGGGAEGCPQSNIQQTLSCKVPETHPAPGFLPRDVVRVSRKSDKPRQSAQRAKRPPGNKSGSLPSLAVFPPRALPLRSSASALSILKRNRTRVGSVARARSIIEPFRRTETPPCVI